MQFILQLCGKLLKTRPVKQIPIQEYINNGLTTAADVTLLEISYTHTHTYVSVLGVPEAVNYPELLTYQKNMIYMGF